MRAASLILLGALACSSTGGGGTMPGSGGSSGATGGAPAATGGATASGGGPATTGGAPASGGAAPATGGARTGGSSVNGGATGAGGSSTGAGGQTAACPTLPTAPLAAASITQFNDNGGWSWYQDERAIVDATANKLIIGSVASGGTRTGNIEATIYDLTAHTTMLSRLGNLPVDDHDAPAFAIRPDGRYVAVWATHRTDCNTYYSIFNGTAWGAQMAYDWTTQGCPWNADDTHRITYSNLWYMSAENRLYDIARSVDTSPNLLASTDNGQTFSYYGRLTFTPLTGYVAGYYKYWGNGTDRIDFLGTEAHPRDFDNNLWHGYIKGGQIYNSTDQVIDSALAGTSATTSAMNINMFTRVFATGTTINGVRLEHAWNQDLVRYADGTIAALWQARVTGTGTTDPDKRQLYARFDGTSWKLTYLVKAGAKLYASEEDYTGLGALDPDNPNVIYVSTTIDPRDDTTQLAKHEIFEGVTCDSGATWRWAPLTQGSTVDNLRPIVPKWDASHRALLWLKGTYTSAQSYAFAVVGNVGAR